MPLLQHHISPGLAESISLRFHGFYIDWAAFGPAPKLWHVRRSSNKKSRCYRELRFLPLNPLHNEESVPEPLWIPSNILLSLPLFRLPSQGTQRAVQAKEHRLEMSLRTFA